MVRVIAIWIAGFALTLLPSLAMIIAGLSVCAGCGLVCQAISTGYVTVTAKAGRSSAVGLYVTSFYVGGSFGAALGGAAGRSAAAGRPASPSSSPCWGSWRPSYISPGRAACRPQPVSRRSNRPNLHCHAIAARSRAQVRTKSMAA